MRFRSATIFLLLAVAACQYTCPKIKCGSVAQQLPTADGDVCVKKTTSGNDSLYQLKLCPSPTTQTCNFSLEVTTGNCTAAEIPEKSRYPGDPCLYGKHCISGSCPEHFCVGTPLGAACTNDVQCVPGAFCNYQGKCDSLVEAGQPCGRGPGKGTCKNHLTCTLGRCVPIGSLPDGNETDNNLACSSLFAMVDSTGKIRCHVGPKLKGGSSLPSECELAKPCTYSFDGSDETFTKPCKCGVNANGKSYCHPGEGAMQSDVSKVSGILIP